MYFYPQDFRQDFLLEQKETVILGWLSHSGNQAEARQSDLKDVQFPEVDIKSQNKLPKRLDTTKGGLLLNKKLLYLNLADDFVSELTYIWCKVPYLGCEIHESIVVS